LFSQKKAIGAIYMAVGPLFRHFCDFEPIWASEGIREDLAEIGQIGQIGVTSSGPNTLPMAPTCMKHIWGWLVEIRRLHSFELKTSLVRL
jgi:hypothetical protein